MSEIRDRARQRVIEILVKPLKVPYQEDAAVMMVQGCINQAEEILSIPELAVVDREAELPIGRWSFQIPGDQQDWLNQKKGYGEAQQDMLKAGWVKEDKNEEV